MIVHRWWSGGQFRKLVESFNTIRLPEWRFGILVSSTEQLKTPTSIISWASISQTRSQSSDLRNIESLLISHTGFSAGYNSTRFVIVQLCYVILKCLDSENREMRRSENARIFETLSLGLFGSRTCAHNDFFESHEYPDAKSFGIKFSNKYYRPDHIFWS